MDVVIQTGLVLFFVFAILLIMGVPISVSIGAAATVAALLLAPWQIAVFTASQKLTSGVDSFALLAIPFFLLAGSIMNSGGIAERLINLARLISGRLPGSLAHTNVVGNMFFGSVSGSAVAAAATMGRTISPMQKEEGYDMRLSTAVNVASSPTGLLLPPSNAFIVYALVSGGTSIAALFVGGVLPGILMGLTVMAVAYFMFRRQNLPVDDRVSLRQAAKIVMDAVPSLLLIVIVLGGITYGVFTATEGASVAVLYAAVLSLLYKSISLSDVPRIFRATVNLSGVILLLISASSIMAWVMAFSNLPTAISEGVLGLSDSAFVILLAMNLVLLIVGTFLDMTPAILIFTPIFLPIAESLGLDPVHFGVILVFNLSIGIMTPPVGSCLFVGCSVAGLKIEQVVRPLLPMLAGLILILLLVTFVPQISLGLPKILGFL